MTVAAAQAERSTDAVCTDDPPAQRRHDLAGQEGITDLPGELTAEEVAREFPDWDISKGSSGLWCARLRESAPLVMTSGEDPTDLRDEIRRKLAQAEHARWLAPHGRGMRP